jgi:hypothetical protein
VQPAHTPAKARAAVRRARYRALEHIFTRPRPSRPTAPRRPAPVEPTPVAPEVTVLADTLSPSATSVTPAPAPTPDDSPTRGVHIHWLKKK